MGQKKRLELGVLLGEGKGDITVWGIKDLFWADRFFRWWKNLLKSSWNRIAPLFERQDENQELPTVNDLLELYRQSNEIRALDRGDYQVFSEIQKPAAHQSASWMVACNGQGKI